MIAAVALPTLTANQVTMAGFGFTLLGVFLTIRSTAKTTQETIISQQRMAATDRRWEARAAVYVELMTVALKFPEVREAIEAWDFATARRWEASLLDLEARVVASSPDEVVKLFDFVKKATMLELHELEPRARELAALEVSVRTPDEEERLQDLRTLKRAGVEDSVPLAVMGNATTELIALLRAEFRNREL